MDAHTGNMPDNISAAGARRLTAQVHAGEQGVGSPPKSPHGHLKLTDADELDPVDGLVEQAVRKATGEEKQYHTRMDHTRAREAKLVDDPIKPRNKPERRAGFGSTAPSGSARAEVRNPRGQRARARAHGGSHTKTEGLESDMSADAREYEAARAGLSGSEGEEEEEEEEEALPEGVSVQPVAPPLTPHGVQAAAAGVKVPPELH